MKSLQPGAAPPTSAAPVPDGVHASLRGGVPAPVLRVLEPSAVVSGHALALDGPGVEARGVSRGTDVQLQLDVRGAWDGRQMTQK